MTAGDESTFDGRWVSVNEFLQAVFADIDPQNHSAYQLNRKLIDVILDYHPLLVLRELSILITKLLEEVDADCRIALAQHTLAYIAARIPVEAEGEA